MRTVGKTIKLLRLERHLNQEQFASLFNVAASTVGMWENDKRVPNEDTKEAICDYFNVDMNYLYGKTNIRNSYREGNDPLLELAPWIGNLINIKNEELIDLLTKISKLTDEEIHLVNSLVDKIIK